MDDEKLILVDEKDNPVGVGDKIGVHVSGLLHRAFSIFIFNTRGELLIQRRALIKYHSGGLWTNTCCGHPRVGESIEVAAHRRLIEEMGFDCALSNEFSFIYKTVFTNGLNEHEYDHVFIGFSDTDPLPDKNEVDDWKWIAIDPLMDDVRKSGDCYTHWFKIAIPEVVKAYPGKNTSMYGVDAR